MLEETHEELLKLSEAACRGVGMWINSTANDSRVEHNTYRWARDRVRQVATMVHPELFEYLEWMIGKIICGVPNQDKLCFILWGEHDNLKSTLGKMFEAAFPFYFASANPSYLFAKNSVHDRSIGDFTERPVRLLFLDEASGIGDGNFIKKMCSPLPLQLELPRSTEKISISNQATVVVTANVDKGLETIKNTAASDSGLVSKLRFIECPAQIVDDEALANDSSAFLRCGGMGEWLKNESIRNGIRRYFVELGRRYAKNNREPECLLVRRMDSAANGTKRTWSDLAPKEKKELVHTILRGMDLLLEWSNEEVDAFWTPDKVTAWCQSPGRVGLLFAVKSSNDYWTEDEVQKWNQRLMPFGKLDSAAVQQLKETLQTHPLPFMDTLKFVTLFNSTYGKLLTSGPVLGQTERIFRVNDNLSASKAPAAGSFTYPLRVLFSEANVTRVVLPFSVQKKKGKGTSCFFLRLK